MPIHAVHSTLAPLASAHLPDSLSVFVRSLPATGTQRIEISKSVPLESVGVEVLRLIVQAAIALGAAWLGAHIGGNRARIAALEAQEKAAKAAAERREAERAADSERRRAVYKRRLKMDLWLAMRLLGRMREGHGHVPIALTASRGLQTLWKGYFRDRNTMLTYENSAESSRIGEVYERCRELGAKAIAFERAFQIRSQGAGSAFEPSKLRGPLLDELMRFNETIKVMLNNYGWQNEVDLAE